ncbi:MAG TPA: NADH-ubiquinone oxidoreductase-F iron-sulfur binding region domain-containing protein, partial [Candidatus Binatus sp.]|nr:NADH-ubiquinone oxidoreductase-F iron-sulfur binding region domain-containing protein [Candidatus Binatus sp.]
LVATGRILGFLAAESAGQCGPCVWGLRAIAETAAALAAAEAGPGAADQLRRWAGLVAGRGACHHPDGAAQLLTSALAVFADDVESHLRGRACLARPDVDVPHLPRNVAGSDRDRPRAAA